jgi:hypothetical protein
LIILSLTLCSLDAENVVKQQKENTSFVLQYLRCMRYSSILSL